MTLEAFPKMQKKWSVGDGRAVEPTAGAGCDSSYLLKLSHGERHAQILVEFVAPSTLTSVGIAREALAPYLGDEELPSRLVVSLDGRSAVSPNVQARGTSSLENGPRGRVT